MSLVDGINDEDKLRQMLNSTNDFEERKLIRARLKELRDEEQQSLADRRKQRDGLGVTDAIKDRAKAADEDKARRLKAINDSASIKVGPQIDPVRAMHDRAELEKAAQLKQYDELAKIPGAGALQGGLEKVKRMEQNFAEQEKQRILEQFGNLQTDLNKKAEAADEQIQLRKQPAAQTSRCAASVNLGGGVCYGAKPGGSSDNRPKSALDANTGSQRSSLLAPGPARGVARNPSAIKQMLLDWCKSMTAGYEGVNVENFSSSWADGLAFCALIHHFHPDSFDFQQLKADDRRHNFTVAFETAERVADISPILDVDDMMKMKNPDWKCVFTYIQFYYKKYRNHTCERHKGGGDA